MTNPKEAYPLTWPAGQPRTKYRTNGPYEVSFERSKNDLLHELKLLRASDIVISTNIPLRNDGFPRSNWTGRLKDDDVGVAVYWMRKKKPFVIACDQYRKIDHNLRAIGLTVASLRGIERAGCTDLLERAFTGFSALPASIDLGPPKRPWREVLLGYGGPDPIIDEPTSALLQSVYKQLVHTCHPDTGGSHEAIVELNRAYEEAKVELGLE